MKIHRTTGIAIGASLLAASAWFIFQPQIEARVFQQGPRISKAFAPAGLRQIHSATMVVNGESTLLELFSAENELPFVAAQFFESRRADAKRSWFHQDGVTAYGFAQDDGQLTRYLFVQVERGQTLLYSLTQAYPLKTKVAADALPSDFPVFPGARTDMSVFHTETRTRMASFTVESTTAVVDEYYKQALSERGWKPMAMTAQIGQAGQGASQRSYRKGNAMCLISCEPVPMSGAVTITVLMKDSIL